MENINALDRETVVILQDRVRSAGGISDKLRAQSDLREFFNRKILQVLRQDEPCIVMYCD